jgi:prephenate dehydratase
MARQGVLIDNLKYVRSHSQAISQCQKLINDYKLEPIIAADTAGSAKYISENSLDDEAAIASTLAAKIYDLKILKKNIEDDKKNITRFLFMGKKIEHPEFKKEENFITSCIFKVKDKPAALYKCLGGFATNDVSLSKLESFSDQSSFEQYLFLCDIVGHIEDPKVQKSLEELGFHTISLEILGVYNASKFRKL